MKSSSVLCILTTGITIACFLIVIIAFVFSIDATRRSDSSEELYLTSWILIVLAIGIILAFVSKAIGTKSTFGFWVKVVATAIVFTIILFAIMLTFGRMYGIT